jgi:tetratricopeptide (TPR) repeat protein
MNARFTPSCSLAQLLILFALFAASSAQQPSPKKQEIYELLASRQFLQAELAARAYLKSNPGDCSVGVFLGIALRGESKPEPALNAFTMALHQCPQSLAALEGAAETAFQLNDPQAKSLLLKVIQARPEEEAGYAMLGAIDARTGDCAGAVENYAKAPNSVNNSVPALRQYGKCLVNVGQPAAAVPVLTHLLELEDNDPNRVALAYAEAAAKDTANAVSTLQPLLGDGSHDSDAFLLAAQIAESTDDTPKAVEWFRRAIQDDPKNVDAYLNFSVVCFNHGAYQVGEDFINLGIQQLPAEARLYLARGVFEEQMTQTDAALRDFERAHRLDPKLSFAEDAIGMLFSQKHDDAKALDLFAEQSRLHPNDALLQYLYAEALSEAANADAKLLAKAIHSAQRATQLEPAYQPARDLLCVLLLRNNDLPGVVAQAEAATKLNPYDDVAIYQELLAEHRLQHLDKASTLVKRLEIAKEHNQHGATKYTLQEAPASSSPPS